MKKDLIFAPAMILVAVALFLLRVTGLPVHIALSVVGIAVLAIYAVLTKKDWKLPALEIAMRVLYGIALISGIAIINLHGVAAIGVIHKVSATIFAALLVFLFAHKLTCKKGE